VSGAKFGGAGSFTLILGAGPATYWPELNVGHLEPEELVSYEFVFSHFNIK